jgi:outer membrane protein assembly factor BamB
VPSSLVCIFGRAVVVSTVFAGIATAFAACSGSQNALVGTPQAISHGTSSITVTIPISVAPPASARSLTPSYYSTKVQSLNVFFFSWTTEQQVAEVTLANLTPSSTNCTTTSAGTTCNIVVNLAPGNYYCTVATYTQPNGHGPVLSIQEDIPVTVAANGSVSTPPWTLWGVPASITATPVLSNALLRVSGNVTTAYSLSPVHYSITALDQGGATLVGPGLPTWTIVSSNSAFAVTQPTAQSPNSFVVAPAGGGPFTTQLSLTASFPQSFINFCRIVGANCTAPVLTLNSLNVTADDWMTYAHDYQRTGYETQRTGISTTTAPKLALRWKVQVPNVNGGIYANPAVYDGNVIVVTSSPEVVYDLSAIDGSVIWQTSIGSGGAKAATIDPHAGAHGLVFVGTRNVGANNTNEPSQLYALNLNDGSTAWQTTVNGLTRGGEVVTGGKIYIPTAGGDPPQCLNAGVQQVDEATGQIGWTWYVNNLTNPNGGGAVWGAIGFDGSHLIFGTGNVCQNSGNQPGVVQTADGAAALDLNGNLLWSFVAWAQFGSDPDALDYDTGSSVMIRSAGSSAETATFVNKNSSMYTFNTSGLNGTTPSAVLQSQLAFNPNFGYGYYTSPTTDGSNVVVQTGAYANSTSSALRRTARDTSGGKIRPDAFTPVGKRRPSRTIPGYHSFLEAFNPSGQSLWAFQMQTFIAGYAAISNGVVISQGDNAIVALAMHGNGTPLWSYPTAGTLDNSPAVVPSGIYIGDLNGNVYAFAPPFSPTATPSSAAVQPLP